MGDNGFWKPFLYSVILCIGLLIGYIIPENSSNKFIEVLDIVNKDYVDSVGGDLENQMISNFLTSLDPHSVYIPAKYYKYSQESLKGNYEGIGIEFDLIDNEVYVLRVVENSPALKAGLETGDQILEANNIPFHDEELKYSAVIESLKGLSNEVLYLKIKKKDGLVKEYEINRASVENSSIKAAFVFNNIGYINFNRFSNNSYKEFLEALTNLKEEGFKSLVIDLRGNGGGFLNEAQKIANEFLEKGELIAYIKGKNRKIQHFYANGNGKYKTGHLILLIDNHSASASEILAGALQDHDRATIIGQVSFGKGLVQETFYFKDSSTLKLTVSRYYLPTGRSIQKNYASLNDSLNSDTFFTLKEKRKMIDGGGIHPDVLYPKLTNDTIERAIWYVIENSLTNKFILKKYEKQKFASPEEFVKGVNLTAKEVRDLIVQIRKKDSINLPITAQFIDKVKIQIRNKIAYNYYGTEYYHYSKVQSEDWISLLKP